MNDNEPTPEERADCELAMAELEAQADMWAVEIRLIDIIKIIGKCTHKISRDMPDDIRVGYINRLEAYIDALMRQAYMDGFYRGGTSRKEYDDRNTRDAA